MKRVLFIVSALLMLSAQVVAQLKSVSGSIGYSQQYTEDLIGNTLWTSRTRSPAFDLSATGILLTEDLAEFELQTYFTQSSMSARGSVLPLDFATQNWTLYRLTLSVLQYTPLWILYNTRDGYVRSKVEYGIESGDVTRTRSRDQALTLSLRRISFLPQMTIGYNRSRAWSEEGFATNTLSQTYTFSTAASNGSTIFNMSGQTSLMQDLQNSSQSRFSTLRFDGTKSFGESHNLDLQSEYSWYDQAGLLKADLIYRGTLETNMNLGAGLNFSQTTATISTTTVYSANANLGHALDDHWRYNFGIGDLYSKLIATLPGNNYSTTFNSWRSNFSIAHARTLGIGSISNSFSLGGQWSVNGENPTSYTGGLSNNYNKGFGNTRVTFFHNTNFSYILRLGKHQTQVGNRLDLAVDSRFYSRVSSNTKISYSDNRSVGTFLGESFTRSISFGEGLRGTFTHVIPFSLSVAFSSNWYFGDISGTTYGWNVDFNSGRFFVERLTASYRYSRHYDILYRIASTSHSVQFSYSWRMISLGLSMYQRTNYSRQRGINFSIARPF